MYVAIRVAVMSVIAICYQLARGQHSIEETFAMALVAVGAGHAAVYGIRSRTFWAVDRMAKCPSTYQTADGAVPAARFRN